MGRIVRPRRSKVGMAPGTPVHTGKRRMEQVQLSLTTYDTTRAEERRPNDVTECFPLPPQPTITWLNVDGLHDIDLLRRIGESAGLHPLVVEDVVSVGQRPKVERYAEQLFIVLRSLTFDDATREVVEEQVSFVLGRSYVLTFQEDPGDSFDAVRRRIHTAGSSVRNRGPDYLVYALMDATVDEYFTVLERIGDRIEDLETELLDRPTPATIREIHHVKRELLVMRKAVWPLRELFASLMRDESTLIAEETRLFLRDAHDHSIQIIDTLETLRDLVAGMIELYLSSVSNRMNEIMKVLTIIATIFIPLTFLVGVYGMNFDAMPELHWGWSYPVLWVVMVAVAAGMLVYFKRRSWL